MSEKTSENMACPISDKEVARKLKMWAQAVSIPGLPRLLEWAAKIIENQPDVVHCAECKYRTMGLCLNSNCVLWGKSPPDDYLCAYGERKESEGK